MESKNLGLFAEEMEHKMTETKLPKAKASRDTARVQMPNRRQLELRPSDLESLLPEGHRARLVWGYVERLDLTALYIQIKAVEGGVGRTPIAPEILLSLWLFATLEGVGSARALARLCQEHDAYRWLCGGVSVNYHTLSDFRVGQGEILDDLLTTSVANLLEVGAVKLKRVAQDGMRVRASAGSKSFRRRERLEEFLEQAKTRVAELKAQVESDPGCMSRREQAARERAARERLVDGGYVTHAQIELGESQSTIYAPVPEIQNDKLAAHAPHSDDSAAVAAWRERMGSEQAKEIYKERAATAECVNALARERGLIRLRVRSLAKTKSVLLLFALAHNVMRTVVLAPALLGLMAPTLKAAK